MYLNQYLATVLDHAPCCYGNRCRGDALVWAWLNRGFLLARSDLGTGMRLLIGWFILALLFLSGTRGYTCLFTGWPRISSSSPTPKLNYRRGNAKRELTGSPGASELQAVYLFTFRIYFTLRSFWFLAMLFLLALIPGVVLSLVSILTLTNNGT